MVALQASPNVILPARSGLLQNPFMQHVRAFDSHGRYQIIPIADKQQERRRVHMARRIVGGCSEANITVCLAGV